MQKDFCFKGELNWSNFYAQRETEKFNARNYLSNHSFVDSVRAFHPVALGSNPNHTYLAFQYLIYLGNQCVYFSLIFENELKFENNLN